MSGQRNVEGDILVFTLDDQLTHMLLRVKGSVAQLQGLGGSSRQHHVATQSDRREYLVRRSV